MQIFIDTAKTEEIREAKKIGVLDGVTTNPSLIAKTGRNARECLEEICSIVDGPVSAEVLALDTEGMVREAREHAKIADNIVVKIPMTIDGLKAVNILSAEGISTNVTLVFSLSQALLVGKAGADYVSPFVGRLDDITHVGMSLVKDIVTVYENYAFETEVLVASIRHPLHVREAALYGADVATIPFNVIQKLSEHPLTTIGIERFLKDAQNIPK